MKKAIRAAAIAAILLFALTFIGNAKIKSASAHLLFSSSVSVGGNESREVTLKSGDRIAIGSYLGEPIVWRVIETGGKTLLMSEKVLCFRAFDPSEDGIGSSDYLVSPLRAWLNSESGFLNPENFSEFDLSLISPDKNGDSIFLPSKDMLKNISAAVCCAAVLGFSSSVYASGQRVFYYTEMFTLIACAAMYSSLSESKAKKFAGYAVPTAAFIFYIINCFTYTFLEIPIMG